MLNDENFRFLKFMLLGTVFSGIMIALNYFAAATAIVRHPAVAVPLGVLAGFGGAIGLLAALWDESDE